MVVGIEPNFARMENKGLVNSWSYKNMVYCVVIVIFANDSSQFSRIDSFESEIQARCYKSLILDCK